MTDKPEFDPNPRAVVGGNKPPRKRATYRRRCPETNTVFTTETHDRLFSDDVAKAAFHNRSSKIGRSLVPLAMAWRAGRNAKGPTAEARALRHTAANAFAAMCRILDEAVAEDRDAGRMPKLDYLRRRFSGDGVLDPRSTAAYWERMDSDPKFKASEERKDAKRRENAKLPPRPSSLPKPGKEPK